MECHIFAIELKTLAVWAFGDMGPSARVWMIRDRDCDLRRHLDSVPPDTLIRDILDRCRVWESHADVDDRCHVKPTLVGTRSVCSVSDRPVRPVNRVVVAVTTPVVGLADLEKLVQKLLLSVPALAPPPSPAPVEIETMLKCLLLLTAAPEPASPPRSAITAMKTGSRRLVQPGMPTSVPRTSPTSNRRDWTTVVCPSCGRPGHGVSWCPYLDETLPYMVGGKGGWTIHDGFAKGSRRASPVGKRRLIQGGESATWISNTLRPPDPGGGGLSTGHLREDAGMDLAPNGPSSDHLWTSRLPVD